MSSEPARVAHQTEATPDAGPCDELVLVACIGPHQLTWVDEAHVVVTYPVGGDTVLSCQPNGAFLLVAAGTSGPYERALVKPDRLVYAPLGAQGAAFIVPYTDKIPNV